MRLQIPDHASQYLQPFERASAGQLERTLALDEARLERRNGQANAPHRPVIAPRYENNAQRISSSRLLRLWLSSSWREVSG